MLGVWHRKWLPLQDGPETNNDLTPFDTLGNRTMDAAELEEHAAQAAQLLGALSNSNRLLILCNLVKGEMAVNALSESINLSQSALSQHLAKLRALDLVSTRRDAQTIYYSIASDEVGKVLATLYDIYCAPAEANAELATAD